MKREIPKAQPKRRNIFKFVAYGLLLVTVLGVFGIWGWISRSPLMTSLITNYNKPPKEVFHQNAMNLLILGCDEDLYYGGKQVLKSAARSDMILVARMDFDKKKITGVSIPRDVSIPRKDRVDKYKDVVKINAAHAAGGPTFAQKVVEDMLDIEIDRTIVLDFKAFQELIDMLGGVEVVVQKDMKYTDTAGGLFIDLKKGKQVLDGYKAMGFVRFRKAGKGGKGGEGENDFTRQQRQKDLMMAIRNKIMQNPAAIPDVAEKSKQIFGGKAFSNDEMASLILFAKNVGAKNIKMGMIPSKERSLKPYILEVDKEKLPEVLTEFGLKESSTASVASRGPVN